MTPLNELPLDNTLKKLGGAVDQALERISDELERHIRRTCLRLSAKYPNRTIRFVSAMGSYSFDIWDNYVWEELDVPILRTFDAMRQKYGWSAIPAPLMFKVRNGKVKRITDW